jgi:hypothetical protein
MEKKINFKGYLSFEDSLKVQRAIMPRRPVPPAVVVSALTLGIVALVLLQMEVRLWMTVLMLLFLVAFMGAGFRLMNNAARKTQAGLYRKACIKRRGTLGGEGIRIQKGQTTKTIPWAQFDKSIEVDGIVAVVKGGESLGFARYMFRSDPDWSRARDLIIGHYN